MVNPDKPTSWLSPVNIYTRIYYIGTGAVRTRHAWQYRILLLSLWNRVLIPPDIINIHPGTSVFFLKNTFLMNLKEVWQIYSRGHTYDSTRLFLSIARFYAAAADLLLVPTPRYVRALQTLCARQNLRVYLPLSLGCVYATETKWPAIQSACVNKWDVYMTTVMPRFCEKVCNTEGQTRNGKSIILSLDDNNPLKQNREGKKNQKISFCFWFELLLRVVRRARKGSQEKVFIIYHTIYI